MTRKQDPNEKQKRNPNAKQRQAQAATRAPLTIANDNAHDRDRLSIGPKTRLMESLSGLLEEHTERAISEPKSQDAIYKLTQSLTMLSKTVREDEAHMVSHKLSLQHLKNTTSPRGINARHDGQKPPVPDKMSLQDALTGIIKSLENFGPEDFDQEAFEAETGLILAPRHKTKH